ncbi:MAG: sodium:proton antiporter [Deltaproteobacteria bacterium]|nr:sodium:proton antiporter [Deltaproteobacteria bacterium]MBW2361181.1 sodium:proton antiporter [Deltaproteobacteria bacterium]
MDVFEILSVLTTLAALFAWLNHRYVRLPPSIGVMLLALLFSLGLVALGALGIHLGAGVEVLLRAVDFDEALLHGMLGALLFVGALHLNLNELASQKGLIALLASGGTLLSTALVGFGAWALFGALGLPLSLVTCLLFGALISPTDPIAVLGILKHLRVPRSLEIKIAGESLFNDGVSVVVFLVLLEVARRGGAPAIGDVLELLVVEVAGGVAFGLGLGWLAYRMLRSVDQYQVETLITLAIVTGGYSAAHALHVSGPLAMVVAGLLIGNHGRRLAMSERTRERLDAFWELVDEFLNAILFVLIGLEVLILDFELRWIAVGLLVIPLVLAARGSSVGAMVWLLRRWRTFSPHAVKTLTWAGLRGGISVALALSLPEGPERDLLVAITYIVVCFSILVQGLSIGPLLARLYP